MQAYLQSAAPLEDIRGLKPFVAGASHPWGITFLLVMGIVLAGTLFYLARRETIEESPITVPTELPLTLRERLDALRQNRLHEMAEAIRFCDQLNEILRDFLLQRYGMATKRLTSSELLNELSHRKVPPHVHSHLETMLTACDLVKFARVRLDSSELHQHLTTAYLVLELTENASDTFEASP